MNVSELPIDTVIPRNAALVAIQDQYGPLLEKVRCGLQSCRTAHQHGFIVSFVADGQDGVGIIGRDCGQNRFGETWTTAERVYETKVHAARTAVAKDRFLSRASRILTELAVLIPRLRQLNEAQKAIHAASPWLVRRCLEAARNGNHEIEFTNPSGATIRRHRLEGAQFWREETVLHVRALGLQKEMACYLEALSDPTVKEKDVARQLDGLRNLESRWEAIEKSAQYAETTLRPGHLKELFSAAGKEMFVDLRIRDSALFKMGFIEGTRKWIFVCDLG